MQGVDLDVGLSRDREQTQVVHPYRRQSLGADPVRALVEHPEAHALEHRQAVGQRHRAATMKQLETQRARHRLQRTIQRHAQRLLVGESRHHLDVGHGGPRFEILAIARGERGAKVTEQRVAAGLAQRLDERVLEVVFPAPRRRNQPCFDCAHVVLRDASRRRAHGDHHTRERRFGKMDVELRAAASKSLC